VFESAFIPFVATAASVAIATGLRRHSARKRQIILTVILQTAISDVTRRGHGTITPDHLLWTLLDVPEVAAACSASANPSGRNCPHRFTSCTTQVRAAIGST
jgi:hypothetical protein